MKPSPTSTKVVAYADLKPEDSTEVVIWGEWDADEMHNTDLDDAIEEALDGRDDRDGELTMGGFKRTTLGEHEPDEDRLLEDALERLDEEYGSPHGDQAEPTPIMKAAARDFAAAIRAEYKPWTCEPVLYVAVPIREWIEKNNPEWLADNVEGASPP